MAMVSVTDDSIADDSMAFSAGFDDGFQVGLWRPAEGDLEGGMLALLRIFTTACPVEAPPFLAAELPPTAAVKAPPTNSRCSLGLEDGFQVGLWRPEEGDLVGEPAKLRFTWCSTGLEVGGVHRGERPS